MICSNCSGNNEETEMELEDVVYGDTVTSQVWVCPKCKTECEDVDNSDYEYEKMRDDKNL